MAAVALVLAGCTGEGDPGGDPSPSETSAPTTASPQPLRVAVFGDKVRLRAYREIVEAYRVEHPDSEVEVKAYRASDAALEEVLTSLEQGWDPDVFLADQRQLPQLIATGGLEPVDTMLEDRGVDFGDGYQRVGLTSFSANSRLQCMPAEVSPLVLYYNKRLLRRAQPPEPLELPTPEDPTWEWETFEPLARVIASLDLLGPIKGAWFPADVNALTAFLRSAGGDIVDDTTQPTSLSLASDEGLEVVGTLAAFARDTSVSLSAEQLDEQDAVDWFADGKLGMLVGTRDDLPRLRAAQGLRFDVLPLPSFGRFRSVAAMTAWCVNGATEQLSAAGDFVAFAVGPEASAIAARSGAMVPSALDALHGRSFTQPRQQPRNAEVYSVAIRRSEPMPYSPAWETVTADVERSLARLYSDPEIDLDATLEARMERLDALSVVRFGGEEGEEGEEGGAESP
jgi:multiple sugar transport system substrate-binding protein